MKAEDMRELSSEEILERIAEIQQELFRLRFRAATAELENPMLLRNLRRDAARFRTVLRERESAGAAS